MVQIKKAVLGIVGGLLLNGAASATEVTYNFTATIQSMFEYDGQTKLNTTVTSSTMPGVLISDGSTIHGQFSYDTAAPLGSYQPAPEKEGSYQLYSGTVTSTLTFDQNGFVYQSDPNPWLTTMQVANDAASRSGWDTFSLETSAAYSPVTFQMMDIHLYDSSGNVFDSSAIPFDLPLSQFSYADIDYSWLRQSDGSQFHASSSITSLTLATPVPEPSTYALLAMGAVVSTVVRRKKKQVVQ